MAKLFDPTKLGDRDYRLNNLYKIQTKAGGVVDFRMKPAQRRYVDTAWWRNIILKPRQLGYTTVIDLLGLDLALFRPNTSVVIIAHTGDAAKDIFRRVVKFAYDNLHPELKKILHLAEKPSQSRMVFCNGSQIQVSTGARSGVHQFVHISEFGPLSVLWPAKAAEIMTGTLETCSKDGYVVIESTAMGPMGLFYDMVKRAEDNRKEYLAGRKVFTQLDYMIHAISAYVEPDYFIPLNGSKLVVPEHLVRYFDSVEQTENVKLPDGFKNWYISKLNGFGDDHEKMKCEYPLRYQDPFEASSKGRIFTAQMAKAIEEGRIGKFPHINAYPVTTYWDLGANDFTVILFTQTVGKFIHIFDVYANRMQPIEHYAAVLRAKGYRYAAHRAPHDSGSISLQTGRTMMQQAAQSGLFLSRIPKVLHKMDSINAARTIFKHCCFHEETTSEVLEKLSEYRWKVDRFTGEPTAIVTHDDFADAFQQIGLGHEFSLSTSTQNIVQAGGY